MAVTDDDCILQDLKLQETYASHWIISAKQVCNTGSECNCSLFLLGSVMLRMLAFLSIYLNLPSALYGIGYDVFIVLTLDF